MLSAATVVVIGEVADKDVPTSMDPTGTWVMFGKVTASDCGGAPTFNQDVWVDKVGKDFVANTGTPGDETSGRVTASLEHAAIDLRVVNPGLGGEYRVQARADRSGSVIGRGELRRRSPTCTAVFALTGRLVPHER
jgi:hypothetical protein